MFLPQFHKVPENDMWWGEGFTDWVSTQDAKALFEGHYQPHVPLNGNYYNLLSKDTMIWQSELMDRYGVDGLCMYHYWFKDGKKILEKPGENLLKWTDINIPFCFCWANETWARSWSKIKGSNVWSNIHEKQKDDSDGILLKQEYGSRKEWEEHFYYLLPFFQDCRYIKVDDRPVFMFYRADQIGCIDEMTECWQELAILNGLPGIFFLGGFRDAIDTLNLNAIFYQEPNHSIKDVEQIQDDKGFKHVSYTDLWSDILSKRGEAMDCYFGGFVGYDDSPRRGLQGVVVENGTPDAFGCFLSELMAKNEAYGNDITFINAWNEWGEGMHLEPDQEYGDQYLRMIKYAKERYKKFVKHYTRSKSGEKQNANEKHEMYLNDLDLWMCIRERGQSVENWLIDNEYRKIALYGYGIMGRHVLAELKDSQYVNVSYLMDKKRISLDIPTYTPDECPPDVDLIIVASYYYFDSIQRILPKGVKSISLGRIIRDLYERCPRD